jgi:hypothetical protein
MAPIAWWGKLVFQRNLLPHFPFKLEAVGSSETLVSHRSNTLMRLCHHQVTVYISIVSSLGSYQIVFPAHASRTFKFDGIILVRITFHHKLFPDFPRCISTQDDSGPAILVPL